MDLKVKAIKPKQPDWIHVLEWKSWWWGSPGAVQHHRYLVRQQSGALTVPTVGWVVHFHWQAETGVVKVASLTCSNFGEDRSGHRYKGFEFWTGGEIVLENPGKVDWSSRLGLRQPRTGRKKNMGMDRPANAHTLGKGDDRNILLWCKDFHSGSCDQAAPHAKIIHGREVSVRHICARCFQKDSAERSHPDTSLSYPHRTWQPSTHKPIHSTQIHPTSRLALNGWMSITRPSIARQWPRGGTCWWMECSRKTWVWYQMGGLSAMSLMDVDRWLGGDPGAEVWVWREGSERG